MSNLMESLGNGLTGNFYSVGKVLSESDKWSDWVNDSDTPILDESTKWSTACLLENMDKWLHAHQLDETVRSVSIGDFQKYALPLVRAIFPELVLNSLVSVQPMLGPQSQVFYLDFIFGTNKGRVKRGENAFSSIARGANEPAFGSPNIDNEQIGTGDGSTTAFTPNLSYVPVVPGSMTISDGNLVVQDTGSGTFTGDGTGTINYATGAVSVTFSIAPSNGNPVTADYVYDMEANPNIPEMELVFNSAPIVARPHKIKTKWSLESSFNAQSLHGIDIDVEMTAALGSWIRFEIDRIGILDIQKMAAAGSVFWNKDMASGTGFVENKLTFSDCLATGSNIIHKVTGRGTGTWVLAGEDVCTIVETLPGFVGTPGLPNGLVKGVYRTGRLMNRWDIFKDPFYDDNKFLLGYKGGSFLEAGYVFCPYIPLFSTPTLVMEDFIARKGLMTSFGKKMINPLFYVTGEIDTGANLERKAGVAAGTLSTTGGTKNAVVTHGKATDLPGITNGRGVFGV